eukprot:3924946-Rhodomonas_salina.1
MRGFFGGFRTLQCFHSCKLRVLWREARHGKVGRHASPDCARYPGNRVRKIVRQVHCTPGTQECPSPTGTSSTTSTKNTKRAGQKGGRENPGHDGEHFVKKEDFT